MPTSTIEIEDNIIDFRPMTYDERTQYYKDKEREKRKTRDKYWL